MSAYYNHPSSPATGYTNYPATAYHPQAMTSGGYSAMPQQHPQHQHHEPQHVAPHSPYHGHSKSMMPAPCHCADCQQAQARCCHQQPAIQMPCQCPECVPVHAPCPCEACFQLQRQQAAPQCYPASAPSNAPPTFLYQPTQQQQQQQHGASLYNNRRESTDSMNSSHSGYDSSPSTNGGSQSLRKKQPAFTHDPYNQRSSTNGGSSRGSGSDDDSQSQHSESSATASHQSQGSHQSFTAPAQAPQAGAHHFPQQLAATPTITVGVTAQQQNASASKAGKRRGGSKHQVPTVVSEESVQSMQGKVVASLSTAGGSSFFQCALTQFPLVTLAVISDEILAHLPRLFLDKHACYVVKALLEQLPRNQSVAALVEVLQSEAFVVMLCTKDLHSRRMMQFVLDLATEECGPRLTEVAINRVFTIANTPHGCISLQRLLDNLDAEGKERFFSAAVRPHLHQFAMMEHAHYIVQYMLAEASAEANSQTIQEAIVESGRLGSMICAKYSSEVVEKSLGVVSHPLQQHIIMSIFTGPETPQALITILSDANANYVVQSAIRSATQETLSVIQQRAGPLCHGLPNGARLLRLMERAGEKFAQSEQ